MITWIEKFLAETASKEEARRLANAREVEKIRAIREGGSQLFDDLGADIRNLVEDFNGRPGESHCRVNVSGQDGLILIKAVITPNWDFTIEVMRREQHFDVSFVPPSYRKLGLFEPDCAEVPRRIEIELTRKGGTFLIVQPSGRGQEPTCGTKGVAQAVIKPLLCRILEAGGRAPKQPSA